jgi:hypothetical protein
VLSELSFPILLVCGLVRAPVTATSPSGALPSCPSLSLMLVLIISFCIPTLFLFATFNVIIQMRCNVVSIFRIDLQKKFACIQNLHII